MDMNVISINTSSSTIPLPQSDLTLFYNRSWKLYKFPGTLPEIQRGDLVKAVESFDDDEATTPVFGEVSECTVNSICIRGTSTLSGVAIHCVSKKAEGSAREFRLIHYTNQAKEVSILLSYVSGPRQRILGLVDEVLELPPCEELRLSTNLLWSQLESYLEGLVPYYSPTTDAHWFIHTIVGKVDLTATTEPPVAPNLRSLDIGVPATEVWTWISSSPQRGNFSRRLRECFVTRTGMPLGQGSSQGIHSIKNLKYTS